MKVSFKQDATMQPDDLQVYVKAAQLSPAVLQILQQIQQLADSHATYSLANALLFCRPTRLWLSKSTAISFPSIPVKKSIKVAANSKRSWPNLTRKHLSK